MISTCIHLLRSIRILRNWPIQIRQALGIFPPKELRLRLRNGWTIQGRVDSIDRCSFNEVWLDRVYDPASASIKWAECKQIVDIGGHIGSFALYAAARAPSANILTVEALPENAALLQKNIEQNGLQDRITLVQAAVSDSVGTTEFGITDSTGGNSLFDYGHTTNRITVPTQTLGSLWQAHGLTRCDVLKIDCEGAEYPILETVDPSLLEHVDCILVEIHDFMRAHGKEPSTLVEKLESMGYTVWESSKSVWCAKRR